ncbi:MAG: hypothetical protein MHMPM18_002976, partial [Marteilia pararefringens]
MAKGAVKKGKAKSGNKAGSVKEVNQIPADGSERLESMDRKELEKYLERLRDEFESERRLKSRYLAEKEMIIDFWDSSKNKIDELNDDLLRLESEKEKNSMSYENGLM